VILGFSMVLQMADLSMLSLKTHNINVNPVLSSLWCLQTRSFVLPGQAEIEIK
jgi:hypothetical protein